VTAASTAEGGPVATAGESAAAAAAAEAAATAAVGGVKVERVKATNAGVVVKKVEVRVVRM